MEQLHTQPSGPVPLPTEPEAPVLEAARVEDLLRAFGAAVRSHRLYGAEGPSLQRFVSTLQQRLSDLWEWVPQLRLEVQEQRFLWDGQAVYPTGGESGELAFLFYKDGIRELVLLPGIEDELPAFLAVVAEAPQVRQDEDDLATLLWERDLSGLRYQAVEPAVEGVELPSGPDAPPPPVDPAAVRSAATAAEPVPGLRPEDFQETLYFLDEAELRRLAEEVRREEARDLWADVVAALFDRLEDGTPERQSRIVRGLAELLPSALGAGRLDRAASLLASLVDLAGRPGLMAPAVLRETRSLFDELSRPETLQQLVQTLEDAPAALHGEDLAVVLGFLPPSALAPLVRATEAATRPDVRRKLETASERLAGENREAVVALLADADPAVASGAARWVGRLGIGSAAPELVRLLSGPQLPVRLAAIQALQELRASTAGQALTRLLEDPEREVRLAAARAVVALGYTAARPALEQAVDSKRLRAADRTEKIAFFEAYGQLAGAEGVALLDRTLNARSWLGRSESTEIRACAALALARVRHPAARAALEAAASDNDPVVRSAVARALRGEGS